MKREGEGKGKGERDDEHTHNPSLLKACPGTSGGGTLTTLAESQPAFAPEPLVIHMPVRARVTCQSCD